MYDSKQIQAYNNDALSYGAVLSVVKHFRSQRIEFEPFLIDDGEDKCAIHMPVFIEDTGYGCGLVRHGTHRSVEALYDESSPVVCHLDEGARVIDREFANKVSLLTDEFVSVALQRSARFVKRYLSGTSVDWTVYGRGYCYLQLLEPNARSRVARILGPFPTISDVMRFVIVAGNWCRKGFFFERFADDYIHVKTRNWSPGTSLRSIIAYSATLSVRCRVGGAALSKVETASLGYSDLFRCAGYVHGLPKTSDVKQFLSTVPVDRINAMLRWMSDHGIAKSEDVLAYLLIATSALAALSVSGTAELKSKVRMWQVFGDVVCKHFVAMHVLSVGGSPEDYARLTGKGRQCNKTMSAVLVASDLLSACSAEGLSLESKAWADIFEGVIGIIAMTQPVSVLRNCLAHFGMIPSDTVVNFVVPNIGSDLTQLNSGDWKKAAELVLKGKL